MKTVRKHFPPRKVLKQVISNIDGGSHRFYGDLEGKGHRTPVYVVIRATSVYISTKMPLPQKAVDDLVEVLEEVEWLLQAACGKPYEITFEVCGDVTTPYNPVSGIASKFWKEIEGE